MPESNAEEQTLHAAEVGGCVNPTAFSSVWAGRWGKSKHQGWHYPHPRDTLKHSEVGPWSAEVDLLYRATQYHSILKYHQKASQLICL